MKSADEEILRARFNSYIKKCLRNEVRNINKAQNRISEHEIALSDLSTKDAGNLSSELQTNIFLHSFCALNYSISVEDDALSEALRHLPEEKRTIILLHFFLDMSNLKISQLTNSKLSRIKKTRQRSLDELRKGMKKNDT